MKFAPALAALGVLFLAAFTTEPNVARPGGDYMSMRQPSADACSAACAEDALCMAWTYSDASGACDLKAVAPPAVPTQGSASGLSPRAPAFTRVAAAPAAPPADAPAPAPPRDTVVAAAPVRGVANPDEEAGDEFGDNLLGGAQTNLVLRSRQAGD